MFIGGVEKRAEVLCDYSVGDHGDHEGIEGGAEDRIFLTKHLVSPSFHFAKVAYQVWLTHIT